LKSGLGKRNTKNEKRNYAEGARSRGPREGACPLRDPRNRWGWSGRHRLHYGAARPRRDRVTTTGTGLDCVRFRRDRKSRAP
jgi:hypothetical protein